MPKVTTYKNSKFATALSFIGYVTIAVGAYAVFNEEPVGGIIAMLVGIGLKVLAAFISQKKQEKEAKFGQ